MTLGWTKIAGACVYAGGVEKRTMRQWCRSGLRHSRLPSGRILIRYADIDQFLERFTAQPDEAERIADETLRGLKVTTRLVRLNSSKKQKEPNPP